MSITTYDELKTAVASWLNRDDLADRIPDFIELGEDRIGHELRIPTLEKSALLSANTSGYANLPADFLELKDVFWNYKPLYRVSLTQLHSYTNEVNEPTYFARETYQLRLFPVPNAATSTSLRLIYYHKPTQLSASNSTNLILQTAPSLMLYAALCEAAQYLAFSPQQLASYEQRYQSGLARLLKHSRDAESAGATPTVANGYG